MSHANVANESFSLKAASSQERFTIENGSDLLQFGTLIEKSEDHLRNLDWALIQITKQDFMPEENLPSHHPNIQLADTEINIPVETCVGSRKVSMGVMYGRSTWLKMEGSRVFEEVKIVKLEGQIGNKPLIPMKAKNF